MFARIVPQLKLIAGLSFLAGLCGCQRAVSVGDLPCAEDERVLCGEHEGMLIAPALQYQRPDASQTASLRWQRRLDEISPCPAADTCAAELAAFVVHESGEVTAAGTFGDRSSSDPLVWFTRLRSDGSVKFSDTNSDANDALRAAPHVQIALERGPDDGALLLVSRGRLKGGTDPDDGQLAGLTITSSGQSELSFAVDTGEIWPGPVALLGSDVVVSSTNFPKVQLARYGRDNQLRWHQTAVTIIPGQREIGLEVGLDDVPTLPALAVDSRDRIWGAVSEGLYGFVQLDPDGTVATHDWIPLMKSPVPPPPLPASPQLVIDSHDRPVFAFEEQVLRFDPDAGDAEQRMPLASQVAQENYYPPLVQALDVDAQDRIYIGTQDGPNSMHVMLIDRIAEDFSTRERFSLALDDATEHAHTITGLHVADDDSVYLSWHPNPLAPEGAAVSIARFQLPTEPSE